MPEYRSDLVWLAADAKMRATVEALLLRYRSIGIRSLVCEPGVVSNLGHDSGCLHYAHELLKPYTGRCAHALVLLDREGCGREHRTREELEIEIEYRLSENGWGNRAAAIVIDPELENWVWSDSPHVATILGWPDQRRELKAHLITCGYWREDDAKPIRPKEAMEEALSARRKGMSSSYFKQLAANVSLTRCTDPAFSKFKTTLQNWFDENERVN